MVNPESSSAARVLHRPAYEQWGGSMFLRGYVAASDEHSAVLLLSWPVLRRIGCGASLTSSATASVGL